MYKITREQLGWKKSTTPESFLLDGNRVSSPTLLANIQMDTFNSKVQTLIYKLPITNDDPLAPLKDALTEWGTLADSRPWFNFNQITLSQTAELLKNLGNTKTYGNDELDATSIKIVTTSLLQPLQFLINQSLRTKKFPTQWKLAKLLPLHKGKGSCKFSPSNYRPISILPVLSKLLEKVVQSQMIQFLNSTNQLNRNHHAYRKIFSTTSAMLQLTERIYRATDNNLITTLLTVDESSAFDCVPHDILIQKMKLYNFSDDVIEWFISYLSGRSQYVEINTKKSKITNMKTGVPQGSVLGPLIYTLYINELPNILKNNNKNCPDENHAQSVELFGKNCNICPEIPCYADDATVVSSTNSRSTNQENLYYQLNTISKFLGSNRLAMNQEKTTIIEIMSRQKRVRTVGTPPSLTVPDKQGNPKILTSQMYTRLLGINIGRDLSWSDHLENGEKSILPILRRQIGALFLLVKQLPKTSRLMLTNGLFMSKLCYLLQIWGSASKNLLKKVQVTMNKAARFVTGWSKRTNTTILMKACNWLLIEELISYQSMISLWNILHKKVPIQIFEQLTLDNDFIVTTNAPRLLLTSNSFKYRSIGKWNQLDLNIRNELSFPRFKKSLKNWIILQRPPEPD